MNCPTTPCPFEPLERLAERFPQIRVEDFMFMGTFPDATRDGMPIAEFKNRNTRRCIALNPLGTRAYHFLHPTGGSRVQVSLPAEVQRVLS